MGIAELRNLQERLKQRPFRYEEWCKVAELYEKNGIKTAANRLRKEAARKQFEIANKAG